MGSQTIRESHFPGLHLISRGKVRDLYDFGDRLLMVASDRLSAFDVVLPTPIPDKGRVLTQISLFWFDFLKNVTGNHLVTAEVVEYPAEARPYLRDLRGRSMLVRKLEMAPVECVVRGYLAGSGWKEYQSSRSVCGIPLPAGLKESSRLPEPIFTPARKAHTGHDENVPFSEVENMVGRETAAQLRDLSLAIYRSAAEYAAARGILLADTKFEFGCDPHDASGRLLLGDEVLTPDSSRFWPADRYQPGRAQESYDKQFVRDYLEQIGWNKQSPGPELPDDVVVRTRDKYRSAYEQVTGRILPGA